MTNHPTQPYERDFEGDPADSVDFKHMTLPDVELDDEEDDSVCPACGEPLEDGDCVNISCPESPLYDEDEAALEDDEDDA